MPATISCRFSRRSRSTTFSSCEAERRGATAIQQHHTRWQGSTPRTCDTPRRSWWAIDAPASFLSASRQHLLGVLRRESGLLIYGRCGSDLSSGEGARLASSATRAQRPPRRAPAERISGPIAPADLLEHHLCDRERILGVDRAPKWQRAHVGEHHRSRRAGVHLRGRGVDADPDNVIIEERHESPLTTADVEDGTAKFRRDHFVDVVAGTPTSASARGRCRSPAGARSPGQVSHRRSGDGVCAARSTVNA